MASKTIFPYRYAPDCLDLNINVNGVDVTAGQDDKRFRVFDSDVDPVHLVLRVRYQPDLVSSLISPEERSTPPVAFKVRYRSIESRIRGTIPVEPDGTATLVLHRRDWVGTLALQAVLVRTKSPQLAVARLAFDEGALLSWSKEVVAVIDEPSRSDSPRFDDFQIRFEYFSSSSDEWRRAHSGDLFALQIASDGPVVYLNESIAALKDIISSKASNGVYARIRDTTTSNIVSQVWGSVLTSIFAKLMRLDDGAMAPSPIDERITEELWDWEQAVLHDWAEFLYPELDSDTAVANVVDEASNATGFGRLVTRLPNAIQSRYNMTNRTFSALVGIRAQLGQFDVDTVTEAVG